MMKIVLLSMHLWPNKILLKFGVKRKKRKKGKKEKETRSTGPNGLD